MFESFIAFLAGLLITFLVNIPVASIDYNSQVIKMNHVLGYINYFIPMNDIFIVWSAWVGMIFFVVFTFGLIRLVRGAVPF